MRIEIPFLPRPELNPNARVSPFKRAGAAAELRKAAWALAYNANPTHEVMFRKAKINVLAVFPTAHLPDPDNFTTMLKPALDGLVDAKIIQDDRKDNVRYVTPFVYEVNRERGPMLILEIEEDDHESSCYTH